MKTESKILNLLDGNCELKTSEIVDKIELTYDTTSKHLKKMTDKNILIRKAIARKIKNKYSWEPTYGPWCYYYKLNINYQQKWK